MKQADTNNLIACTGGFVTRFMAGVIQKPIRGSAGSGFNAGLDAVDLGGYCLDVPQWLPSGSTVWVPAGHATSNLVERP